MYDAQLPSGLYVRARLSALGARHAFVEKETNEPLQFFETATAAESMVREWDRHFESARAKRGR